MAYNIAEDLWYQYFTADGPQWLILLFMYGFRTLWAAIGILVDLGIVYITVKTPSLRSICNILIATESFCALVLNLGYFISFFVVASGTKFIRYEHCFWALILPSLFGTLAQPVMVFTGLDRVFAVACPFWYQQRSAKKYLALVSSFLILYGIFVFVVYYLDYMQTKDIMLSCSTHEMLQSSLAPIMKFSGLAMSALIIIVYTFCWFFVFKFASTSQNVTENNRKLNKSLMFIIGLNLFGVFAKIIIDQILQAFLVANVFIHTPYSTVYSFLTIAVYSANAPVLYIMSSEYRARFDQHFPWIVKIYGKIARSTATVMPSATPPRPWIIINNGIGPAMNGGITPRHI
ncbi:hypothetical protein niasHT_015148 [Heterodera trifolii]|uniref:G-protein coupled receptors family 1 profile domain-containing protein n=1 Tax=Heterodera trifolii TaxID=157864 RepID=A0ABD2L9P2_9BILA